MQTTHSDTAKPQGTPGPLLDIKTQINAIKKLPPMPEMTQKILQLNANPNASIKDLAKIVELDPSLAAQVMRYASSPFFSYRGKLDSIQTAISRVLGYSMVMNLALGVTAAKPFRIPKNIPLGLDKHWRHAIYSAALTQALSNELPDELRPAAGTAYLAGLLHNFGHLLVGHLFRKEFLILNKFIARLPNSPIIEVEKDVLGADHSEVGAWLMKAWNLPEEIIVATREHHNPNYQGPHAIFSKLVMLSDHLLKQHNIGDAPNGNLPKGVLDSLEIGEYQALGILEKILDGESNLDSMAQQLAA